MCILLKKNKKEEFIYHEAYHGVKYLAKPTVELYKKACHYIVLDISAKYDTFSKASKTIEGRHQKFVTVK